ncbi:MAG: hypothetical protein Q8P25_03465 [Candidatus Curtissbacteria bacterium]|nr:hypothetical protein [Candidatus Curtissbacteria bacterium]
MFSQKKFYAFLLIILSLFFVAQFTNLRKHTQSFRFGDESEHLTPGWMMANHGSKLYTDISTNHQPIPIIASFLFFKTVDPPNLFMLIERVRQFMLVISFIGAFILVIKFRMLGLVSVLLTETVTFWLFGYHLLAESIALYPTMFIMGNTAEVIFWKKQQNKQLFKKIEPIIFGLCIFLIAFSLLPSVPFLALASIVYLYHAKPEDRKLVLLSVLVPTILMFVFIDFKGWFHNTVLDNIRYFLPYEAGTQGFRSHFAILIYPFQSLLNHSGPVAKYYLFLIVLSAISICAILTSNKKKPFILKVAFLYTLLMLLNLRIPKIDVGFYTAFHVLPHLGAFTIISVILLKLAIEKIGNKPKKKIVFMALSGTLIAVALFFNTAWWRESKDKNEEHFIQYGDIQSLSTAFKTLKQEGDKLLAGELEGLFNITSDLPLAGKQNAYLNWSYKSEESKRNLIELMMYNPPTFVYFPEGGLYFRLLEPYLVREYTRIQRYDGGLTNGYIKTSEIHKRTAKQWRDFENGFYKIPKEANL